MMYILENIQRKLLLFFRPSPKSIYSWMLTRQRCVIILQIELELYDFA